MLMYQCIGHIVYEGYKDSFFMGRALREVEWYLHAQPQVALLFHHGHAPEAPQDHVVVGVLPGVPDGHIL